MGQKPPGLADAMALTPARSTNQYNVQYVGQWGSHPGTDPRPATHWTNALTIRASRRGGKWNQITSQVAPAIRFALGKVDAQRFYTKAIDRVRGSNKSGLGWSKDAFDRVDWEALSQALGHKPESFQLWLSKQSIGVCAMQKNTMRIQDILGNCCPNCGE
jgi:hypothetical protein